jgi:hypothetical protein
MYVLQIVQYLILLFVVCIFFLLPEQGVLTKMFTSKESKGFIESGSSAFRLFSERPRPPYSQHDFDQGFQIFLVTTYKNGKNIPDYHEIYQKAVK